LAYYNYDSIRMKQLCNTVKFNMKFISNWFFYYSANRDIDSENEDGTKDHYESSTQGFGKGGELCFRSCDSF